jgi:DNA ligase 1
MQELKQFIEKMRATSSSLDKVEILKKQSNFIKEVLEYTYSPYKQYNVTSETCKKNSKLVEMGPITPLFKLLDKLSNRESTGHDAIKLVNRFAQSDDNFNLIYDIIDKDLKIRAGSKVINKAFPNLIPEFNVALAQEYKGKCDWNDGWYASRKLDGVRCLAVVDGVGKCTLYSRMGKEFTTLNKIKHAIEATNIINYVFDGEICLLDKDGNEDFQSVMKELRRKDHQIENPTFMIFDMIHKIDFDNGKSEDGSILSDRLHTLRTWLGPRYDTKETLRYLEQYQITDNDHFTLGSNVKSRRMGRYYVT